MRTREQNCCGIEADEEETKRESTSISPCYKVVFSIVYTWYFILIFLKINFGIVYFVVVSKRCFLIRKITLIIKYLKLKKERTRA